MIDFTSSDGHVNSTELVENVSEVKKTLEHQLVVKTYGRNMMGRLLSIVNSSTPLEQSLIAYETSRIGLGPYLFGSDEIGRVEEFIKCRTLTHEEAFRDDVAVAFAKFHSLKLPLTRERCVDRERGDFARMKKTYDVILEITSRKKFKCTAVENLIEQMNWLKSISNVIGLKHRNVLVSGDPNYMNVLVLDSPSETKSSVMLIDYDCTCYSWRGIELGGHFVCQLFNFKEFSDFKTDFLYPDESTQRLFLEKYLNEWKRLNINLVDDQIDSLENLLKESYIGAMFCCLLWSWFRYCVYDDFENFGENFFLEEPKTFSTYLLLKNTFQSKYM